MKKIFGKILLVSILVTEMFANVTVSVNSPAIYKGDIVNFAISADGNSIEFPNIQEIAGFPIVGTASSQSVNIINGDVTRTISKTYSFRPTKSVTIPQFTVNIDGKSYRTKELKIEVLKPQAGKRGDPFILEMKLNKREAFVGEPLDLTLIFKRKLNARLDKLQLGEPKLEDFWVKKVNGIEQGSEGDYIVEKMHYQLFPQKSGEFHIPPLEALIGIRNRRGGFGGFNDPFFDSFIENLDWKKIFSNELTLKVNPLPNGLELYGNYTIQAKVDKRKVYANKPVNLIVTVEGRGNIDDVKKFNPTIPNTIVYADEPKITSKLINGVYQGRFTQKIAIIGDANFTIPPLELSYFDKESNQTKTIKTEPIDIEVIGGGNTQKQPLIQVSPEMEKIAPKVQTEKVVVSEESYIKYLFLAIGFVLGILSSIGFNRLKNRTTKRENSVVKAIKKAKGDRELFNILLPYAKQDEVISQTLNRLEENIYKGAKHKIEREVLMEVFEEE